MQRSTAQNVVDSSPVPMVAEPIFAHSPGLEPYTPPTLQFSRSDVEFRFDAEGMVDIALSVTNPGPGMSPPRRGRIEMAAFGAFLPWFPLTPFAVPRLRPGESTLIRLRVPRTALGGELPPEPPQEVKPVLPAVARARRAIEDFLDSVFKKPKQFRPMTAPHLAGNLNVHIGATSVERHLSGPLRVYPGQMNLAFFNVGAGDDAYRFELRGDEATWQASLHQMRNMTEVGSEVIAGEWYSFRARSSVVLAVAPPAECRRGAIEVHVEQRSTGRMAVVEFDLDPSALEAGCYTV